MHSPALDLMNLAAQAAAAQAAPYTFADSSAEAVNTAMAVKPPLYARQAMDTFVAELKTGGIWALCDVIYALGAGFSNADQLINWKNPGTFTASAVGTPVQSPGKGIASASLNDYVDTNWNMLSNAVNFTQNSAHLMVATDTDLINSSITVGNLSSNAIGVLLRNPSDQLNLRINANSGQLLTNTSGIGRFLLNRTGSTASEAFRNGVSLGTSSIASTAVVSGKLGIGRGATNVNTRRVNFVSAGAGLTAPQAAAYEAALAKFLTALGIA